MVEKHNGLEKALDHLISPDETQGSDPIAPEMLVAYYEGKLSPPEAKALESRLIQDEEATRFLNDLKQFPDLEPAAGAPEIDDAHIDAAFGELTTRLETEPNILSVPTPGPPRREKWLVTLSGWLVAAVALFALGYSLRNGSGKSKPEIGIQVVNLFTNTTRESLEPMPREETFLSLHIPYPANQAEGYRVIVYGPGGNLLHRYPDYSGSSKVLSLRLPSHFLAEGGTYTIKLFSLNNAESTFITDFHLPYR